MRCPRCGHDDNKVVDSRVSREGDVTRRRRECLACHSRFTTYERIEEELPLVVKRDGRREPFDRQKIFNGITTALQKRAYEREQVEGIIEGIEADLVQRGDKEISSEWLGERVMEELRKLDHVAFVRFASVYRQFADISEFVKEIRSLKPPARPVRPS